eukprot:6185192-Pleurochrysis_carterae.AAC.6
MRTIEGEGVIDCTHKHAKNRGRSAISRQNKIYTIFKTKELKQEERGDKEQKQNIGVIPPRLEDDGIILGLPKTKPKRAPPSGPRKENEGLLFYVQDGKVFGKQGDKGRGPVPRDKIQTIDADAEFRSMFIGKTRVCIAPSCPSGVVLKPGVEVKGIDPRTMFNSCTSHPRIKYARSAEKWGTIKLCRAFIGNGRIPDNNCFMFKWRDAVKPETIRTTNTRKPRSRITPADRAKLLSEMYKVEIMSKGGDDKHNILPQDQLSVQSI